MQSDIIESLGVRSNSGDSVFKGSFNRANLKLDAMAVRRLSGYVATIRSKITAGCSVVYCITCQEVETMCEQLREHLNEMVAKYQGKMEATDKKNAHQAWDSGVARAIVATSASAIGDRHARCALLRAYRIIQVIGFINPRNREDWARMEPM